MGLESGLSDPHVGAQVVSAGYIFLRDGSRGSGFVLQGIEHGFQAATTPKSKQNISLDEKNAVFTGLRSQLKVHSEQASNTQKYKKKKFTDFDWHLDLNSLHLDLS